MRKVILSLLLLVWATGSFAVENSEDETDDCEKQVMSSLTKGEATIPSVGDGSKDKNTNKSVNGTSSTPQ